MISIIIPVYRSEKTLERCIRSLTGQTFPDLEIIMVVESPPDPSGILADRLAETDRRIRVLHRQNQGVSAARNAGLEAARGEFIQFVDSDDYVDRNLCQKLLEGLRTSGAQLAICGFHHLYFGKDVVKLPRRPGSLVLRDARQELLALYEDGFLNMPWNKLYRRELIREGFCRDMDLGEDLVFNLACLKECAEVVVVQEALCYYIQDGRGTTLSTRRRQDRMENALYLYGRLKAFLREMYGTEDSCGVLESRLMAEFLDEMEGLAFDNSMAAAEKREVIKGYYGGYEQIPNKAAIRLKLPDYRILYFFFRRRFFGMTLLLVVLRGLVVRLVRGIGRGKRIAA